MLQSRHERTHIDDISYAANERDLYWNKRKLAKSEEDEQWKEDERVGKRQEKMSWKMKMGNETKRAQINSTP